LFRPYCQSAEEMRMLIDTFVMERALDDRTIASHRFAGAVKFQSERVMYGHRKNISETTSTLSRVLDMLIIPLMYQIHADSCESFKLSKTESRDMIDEILAVSRESKIVENFQKTRDSLKVKKNIGYPYFPRSFPLMLIDTICDLHFDSELEYVEGSSILIIDESDNTFYMFKERPEKTFNLPGGKREGNESMYSSLLRELGEEGVRVHDHVLSPARMPDLITASVDIKRRTGGYNWTWVIKKSEIRSFPKAEFKWISISDFADGKGNDNSVAPWVRRVIANFWKYGWKSTYLQMPYTPLTIFSANPEDNYFEYINFNVNWNFMNLSEIANFYNAEFNSFTYKIGSPPQSMRFINIPFSTDDVTMISVIYENERIKKIRSISNWAESFDG